LNYHNDYLHHGQRPAAFCGSHAWGKMYCPYNDVECRCGEFCITSIWSTPKNPGNHARQLRRVVDNCVAHKRAEAAKSEPESE